MLRAFLAPLTLSRGGVSARLTVRSFAVAAKGPEVGTMLTFIHDGLKPMKSHNDVFDLSLDESSQQLALDLGADKGCFTIQPQGDNIAVLSPMGSLHMYKYDGGKDWWCDVHDDHNLLEKLTRDVMYLAHGYPTF